MRKVTIFIITLFAAIFLFPEESIANDNEELFAEYFKKNPQLKEFLQYKNTKLMMDAIANEPEAEKIISFFKKIDELISNYKTDPKAFRKTNRRKKLDSLSAPAYSAVKEIARKNSQKNLRDGKREKQVEATQKTLNDLIHNLLSEIMYKEIQYKAMYSDEKTKDFINKRKKKFMEIENEFNLADQIICADTLLTDEKYFNFKTSLQLVFLKTADKCGEIYYGKNPRPLTCKGEIGFCLNSKSTSVSFQISSNSKKNYDIKSMNNVTSHVDYAIGYFWQKNHFCSCICNQRDNVFFDAAFYTGVFKYDNDDVIVGVTFVKRHKTVILLPIIGKLGLDCEIIDETIRYAEYPSRFDIENNRTTMKLNKRDLILSDVHFSDGEIVTGLKLYNSNQGIALGLYGKKTNSTKCYLKNTEHTFIGTAIQSKRKGDMIYVRHKTVGIDTTKHDDADVLVIGLNNSKHYVRFGPGNNDITSSLGQITVPGFSLEPIVQSKPLKGIGFFYVNNNDLDFSGFIKPYVKTIDSFFKPEKIFLKN